jgi:hypothetical protein
LNNKETSNKICFIIPYFGKVPPYFPLFLKSVIGQPFDVFFFTDIPAVEDLPKNVIWNIISFSGLKQLMESKLNIEVALEKPYKLIDFKPAYGLIFENYISDYQFWGTLDIDTVVGNFRNFFNAKKLAEIDFFSGISSYVSGSIFFIRNNTYCNNLFKNSRDWKNVFTNKKVLGFDECGGRYFVQLQAGANIFDLKTQTKSFTEVLLLAEKEGLRTFFSNYILEPKGMTPVSIEKEGIFYNSKEYLLVHFIYFKTTYYFHIRKSISTPPYYITGLGTFKNKPTFINSLFSLNMVYGVRNKIKINLRKLRFKKSKRK